ncbi:hypothetical protein GCM10012275_48260 [Longimycelium tulufanense]|uniref:Helix-turn-helix domain-containing protein n=1 Tax=Longimycelium tulufanense TaxID=907463 RepID=A0A8J3FXY9_9PSEU|nr:helix-turn-helix domain-containing protein [Longimycelium tulufanense]GGM72064.1 hypothetical protein GCM10012275_48260 [Longimycelium tulufanense]
MGDVVAFRRRAASPRTNATERAGSVPDIAEDRLTYTVAEVAYLLSLSRGVTYRMVREGEIPARRIGRRWVIPRAAFREWLNNLPQHEGEI